jgi:RNA polymerase sigma factor (sigma-70 family)
MSMLLSDERLARQAAGGEEAAFTAIFDRYHQQLYRYCLAIVGDAQDAQDALQNTMLKVLGALPGEERELKLKPWLYRIAHNESIDLLRRRRDTRQLDAELATPTPALADELDSRERLRQLLADLDELPERQRGALVMRELAGLDFAAIGTALDTSAAVARQTLYEARLSLRRMGEGRDMDCMTVTKALSDGDGRVARRRDVRAHLRHCASCRDFQDEIERRGHDFAALAPLPAALAAGLLQGLLGGTGSSGGAAVGGAAIAGGAAKSIGSFSALKGAAAVLAIAAVGTGAADRSGLIELGLPGSNGSSSVPSPRASSNAERGLPARAARRIGAFAAGSHDSRARRATHARVAERKRAGESQAAGHARSGGQEGRGAASTTAGAASPRSSAHSHGRGHEKQLPAASRHGQETAAAHKGAGQGSAADSAGSAHGAKSSHPAHQAHPPHPAKPSPPTSAADKVPPVEGGTSPSGPKREGATQGDHSAEEAGGKRETGE